MPFPSPRPRLGGSGRVIPVTRRREPSRGESLLLLGQEKRVGDQMCEPEDRALHHHQRFLVHHQALELDSPVCQARLPRQLDKDSRLFCRLLAVTVVDMSGAPSIA